jgi:hypothetical protein
MKQSIILALAIAFIACSKNSTTSNPDVTTTNNFSRLYAKMYNVTSVDSSSSTTIVIRTTDVPDHKSPFFGAGNEKYEAYNGDNPNFSASVTINGTVSTPTLMSQNLTFRIPRYPVESSTHTSTTGGPIGIGRNGVVFFNQYNGQGAALDNPEINNVDQYLGHPTPSKLWWCTIPLSF